MLVRQDLSEELVETVDRSGERAARGPQWPVHVPGSTCSWLAAWWIPQVQGRCRHPADGSGSSSVRVGSGSRSGSSSGFIGRQRKVQRLVHVEFGGPVPGRVPAVRRGSSSGSDSSSGPPGSGSGSGAPSSRQALMRCIVLHRGWHGGCLPRSGSRVTLAVRQQRHRRGGKGGMIPKVIYTADLVSETPRQSGSRRGGTRGRPCIPSGTW